MLAYGNCQTEATRYYKPIQNMIAWRVKAFYNRNKAISCLPRIGNFSRAIYRLGY